MSINTLKLNDDVYIHCFELGGGLERWDIESKSYQTSHVKLNLENCGDIKIEGFEEQKDLSFDVLPLESKTLCVVKKGDNFKENPALTITEDPIIVNRIKPKSAKTGPKSAMKVWNDIIKMPFEVLEADDLEDRIRACGHDSFVDPSFPPDDSSLYDITNASEYPLEEKAVWKRPHQFMRFGEIELFEGDINPNDIIQGYLGNCWFLAAIAAVAETPELIRRLFITDKYNEFGIYKLRICKNGEWVVVTIDDYFPCYLDGGPVFSQPNGNELWLILVEKAYAKLHGNYNQLNLGFINHAMMDLSGCPTQCYNFPDKKASSTEKRVFFENLWRIMDTSCKKGHTICAGTPGVDEATMGNRPDEKFGIVPGHAYSVLKVQQYKDIQLIKLRNPWGNFEWGGAWSDVDKRWTEELRRVFKPDFNINDGIFWMSYKDFIERYDQVMVCKVENWNEVRLKGKFIKVQEMSSTNDWILSQFYYTFSLSQSTHLEIGIHQEDERILGAERRPYIDLSYVILKRERSGELKVAGIADNVSERDVEQGFELTEGDYIVVPRCIGGLLKAPDLDADPIKLKVRLDGVETFNKLAYSAINDIFRKIDLQLDGVLTSKELNQFGQITDEDFFRKITDRTFTSRDFEDISCTENGLTRFGMTQILNSFPESKLKKMFSRMGYDDRMFSMKSRVFVITFHSSIPLRVAIKDAIKSDINEKAINLIMDDYTKINGLDNAREDSNVIVFRKYHAKAYGFSYAAINKRDQDVEVTLNMTTSTGCAFTPSCGMSQVIIPAKSMAYLGGSVIEPTSTSLRANYTYKSRVI